MNWVWWPALGAIAGVIYHFVEDRRLSSRVRHFDRSGDALSRARRLRAFVRRSVSHAGLRVSDPRPWLRDSPLATLDRGHGFCGEVSRVLIRLLRREGLDARRVYLRRSREDHHVSTELVIGRERFILDAQRGRPFVVAYDEYLKSSGMKLRGYWSPRIWPYEGQGLGRLQLYRPPVAYTVLTESPALMLALFSLLLAVTLAALGGRPA